MTNIQRANAQADHLNEVGYSHPAYMQIALRGILHALLALHDQQSPTTVTLTTKPTRAPRTNTEDPK